MRFSARGDEAETSAITRGVIINYLAAGKKSKRERRAEKRKEGEEKATSKASARL